MLLLYSCTTAAFACVWYVSSMRKAAYDFVDVLYTPPFAEDYLCTPANLISEISGTFIIFNSDLLMVRFAPLALAQICQAHAHPCRLDIPDVHRSNPSPSHHRASHCPAHGTMRSVQHACVNYD
jgi:hypothetical protein